MNGKICGFSRSSFSQEGSWRKTADAAPLSAKARRCGINFLLAFSVQRRSAGAGGYIRGMFSFDTKREPEKCQRFRRAGSTKKGLLAPFNPKEVGYTDLKPLSLAALDSSPRGSTPSQALPRQIPPFVTCGDIFPRSGGSLSSQGEPSRYIRH